MIPAKQQNHDLTVESSINPAQALPNPAGVGPSQTQAGANCNASPVQWPAVGSPAIAAAMLFVKPLKRG